MAKKEIETFETTLGQLPELFERLGIAAERKVTIIIEPEAEPSFEPRKPRVQIIVAALHK